MRTEGKQLTLPCENQRRLPEGSGKGPKPERALLWQNFPDSHSLLAPCCSSRLCQRQPDTLRMEPAKPGVEPVKKQPSSLCSQKASYKCISDLLVSQFFWSSSSSSRWLLRKLLCSQSGPQLWQSRNAVSLLAPLASSHIIEWSRNVKDLSVSVLPSQRVEGQTQPEAA